eukprot:CAMPEP_0197627368 /NCGR_PEP_ID=MMETSP1338-20131121/6005_1 /TAXON_ID=43686 ORGANISM="Pelagodinium beii, Strain RCC1491" /NCGR_SAMPLE_ID=MMETSP1338 /ASSEMBLY_ACC=CAM_ASM_000754 /LENGTH=428 /DNA_ID=CAMNT_0043198071 /DNA_START=27 /DNA_END=1310 /DNA_ORIENTATION=+
MFKYLISAHVLSMVALAARNSDFTADDTAMHMTLDAPDFKCCLMDVTIRSPSGQADPFKIANFPCKQGLKLFASRTCKAKTYSFVGADVEVANTADAEPGCYYQKIEEMPFCREESAYKQNLRRMIESLQSFIAEDGKPIGDDFGSLLKELQRLRELRRSHSVLEWHEKRQKARLQSDPLVAESIKRASMEDKLPVSTMDDYVYLSLPVVKEIAQLASMDDRPLWSPADPMVGLWSRNPHDAAHWDFALINIERDSAGQLVHKGEVTATLKWSKGKFESHEREGAGVYHVSYFQHADRPHELQHQAWLELDSPGIQSTLESIAIEEAKTSYDTAFRVGRLLSHPPTASELEALWREDAASMMSLCQLMALSSGSATPEQCLPETVSHGSSSVDEANEKKHEMLGQWMRDHQDLEALYPHDDDDDDDDD